jgi:hypothetical protein
MNHKQGNHFQSGARATASDFAATRINIKRFHSAKLSIAIAVTLLTVTVCWIGIRAQLRDTAFPARTHAPRSNLDSRSSPQMRSISTAGRPNGT